MRDERAAMELLVSHGHSVGNRVDHPRDGPIRGSAAAQSQRRLTLVLGLTSAYMAAEVVGGLLTNSLALLADAAHMFTDVLGLALALFAIRFAQRPATPAKTYGFYRTEILAAFANGLVLFGVAGYILYEAWQRLQAPPEVNTVPMLGIAVGGLAVNVLGALLLYEGAAASLNVRGAFVHVLGDLLGSLGVIVAAVAILLTGWYPADSLISVLIGLFILPRTWRLLRGAVDVLLEATPAHLNLREVEAAMRAVPGVSSVHDLHIWTITSGYEALTGHILAQERQCSDVLHDVQTLLRDRFKIAHATLQVERPGHAEDGACCAVDPRCLTAGLSAEDLASIAKS